jgi:hypothetical protein
MVILCLRRLNWRGMVYIVHRRCRLMDTEGRVEGVDMEERGMAVREVEEAGIRMPLHHLHMVVPLLTADSHMLPLTVSVSVILHSAAALGFTCGFVER